jgi:hypothetical protein
MSLITKLPYFIVSFLFISLFFLEPAYAYVGPAIAFVSYLLGPVVAVLAAIGIVLYLPVKKLIKKKNASKNEEQNEKAVENNNHEN